MTELRVARMRKRYRLPEETAHDDRARLDRLLASAIDGELIDAALERAGIPATDEICIRRVTSAARLRSADPDARLAVQWSIALADAIAGTLRAGGPEVVRYGSRHQALVDMMCSAARGDLTRAWAWRQLGIWNAGDALSPAAAIVAAVGALAREPHAAPAVLRAAESAGVLATLIIGASAEQWTQLARVALSVAGASAAMTAALREAAGDTESAPRAIVDRIAAASSILRAARRAEHVHAASRALAALAMLECEPELAARAQPALLAALAERIGREESAVARADMNEARNAEATPAAARRRRDFREGADRGQNGKSAKSNASQSARVADQSTATDTDSSAFDDNARADRRVRAVTAHGGLLFFLHIVRALGVPTLAGRPLRWTLYRLALTFAPVDAGDPAALAFIGLAPGSRTPFEDEPAETDAERAEIAAFRVALVASLRERMAAPPGEGDDALVQRVVTRRAEIVADPAWIELRFALADATTDVRRAALDFDPGWIPWLGVVVRFIYV